MVCAEIVLASLMLAKTFSFEPFVSISRGKSNILISLKHAVKVGDVITDAKNTFIGPENEGILANAADYGVASKIS